MTFKFHKKILFNRKKTKICILLYKKKLIDLKFHSYNLLRK